MKKLDSLMKSCTKCGLCETRTNVVPGEGSYDPEVVIIGENPGVNEDQQAKPFIGASGKALDKVLDHIDLKREDIYITNIVKCKTPSNRDPVDREIETCKPWLDKQLELLTPRIIITLGRFASQNILGVDSPMGKMRRKIYQINVGDDFPLVVPIFHPAVTLYRPSSREYFYKDFELIKQLMT